MRNKKKYEIKKSIVIFILLFIFRNSNSQYYHFGVSLNYFKDYSINEAIEGARNTNKSILVYLHKNKCEGCVKFAESVLQDTAIEKLAKAKFICVGNDIRKKDSDKITGDLEIFSSPALVLMNVEGDLKCSIRLSLNIDSILFYLNCWSKLTNIFLQIKTHALQTNIKNIEAAKLIGESYAKKDFANRKNTNPEKIAFEYTLGSPDVRGFEEGYIKRWNELNDK